MRSRGADVVINRKASLLRDHDGLRRVLVRAADAAGSRVHETESLEDLDRVAREIAARGSDAIVLAGGDGSYMAGLSALARAHATKEMPPLALAPGGTVCTVARNLGTGGRRRTWAERVVLAAGDGSASARPQATLRVRDDSGGNRVGFIFGTGLVVRFFDAYYATRRPGRFAAASLAARIFAGSFTGAPFAKGVLDPMACSLRVDDRLLPTRQWSLVVASVVRDVGLHMLVSYRAGEELGRFHLVASGLTLRALAEQLPRVLLGRPMAGEPRVDALAGSLRIAFEGPSGGYVLDGDRFPARAVTVEPGPVVSLLEI